jgi:hypothetical protein
MSLPLQLQGPRAITRAYPESPENGGQNVSTIQPKGENIRQAIRWISQEKEDDPGKPFSKLIQQACLRFNLTPKDEIYLESFYRKCDP